MKYKPNQLFIRYKIDPLCSNSNIGSVIKILNDKSFIYLKHVSIRNNDSEYLRSLTYITLTELECKTLDLTDPY